MARALRHLAAAAVFVTVALTVSTVSATAVAVASSPRIAAADGDVTCGMYPTESDCSHDSQCFWNEPLGLCTPTCNGYNQYDACTANPSCSYGYTSCYIRCKLLTNPTLCTLGGPQPPEACSWSVRILPSLHRWTVPPSSMVTLPLVGVKICSTA